MAYEQIGFQLYRAIVFIDSLIKFSSRKILHNYYTVSSWKPLNNYKNVGFSLQAYTLIEI